MNKAKGKEKRESKPVERIQKIHADLRGGTCTYSCD